MEHTPHAHPSSLPPTLAHQARVHARTRGGVHRLGSQDTPRNQYVAISSRPKNQLMPVVRPFILATNEGLESNVCCIQEEHRSIKLNRLFNFYEIKIAVKL